MRFLFSFNGMCVFLNIACVFLNVACVFLNVSFIYFQCCLRLTQKGEFLSKGDLGGAGTLLRLQGCESS